MDKKTALKILGLKENASFDDARQSYRELAKEHHPDRSPGKGRKMDDTRMKEINLAYLSLSSLFKNKTAKPTARKHETKTASGPVRQARRSKKNPWSDIDKIIIDRLSAIISDIAKEFQVYIKKRSEQNRTVKSNNKVRQNRTTSGSTKKFDQVFRRIHGKRMHPVTSQASHKRIRSKRSVANNQSYKAFQNYMALKNKIKANQKRQQQNMGISRVEKIEPVRPIKPVER